MTESNAILRLDNVGFQADGVTILNEMSFQLRAGEFKLITGPSGCGKSTLLKIIASLLSPTAGSIFFAGKNINDLTPETYRQQVPVADPSSTAGSQRAGRRSAALRAGGEYAGKVNQ